MTDKNKDHNGLMMTGALSTGITDNPYSSYGLLAYINAVVDKFPSLKSVVTSYNINTGVLLTPQVISLLDGEISRDPGIIYDSFLLIDLVNIYSLETTGDIDTVYNEVVNSIIKTRAIFKQETVISETALDPYTIINIESFSELLHSNKTMVAIYLYILTTVLF